MAEAPISAPASSQNPPQVAAAAEQTSGAPSTPFPLEEQAETQGPTWNPWSGPTPTHWYSGLGFTEDNDYLGPLAAIEHGEMSGEAKGVAVLTGLWHEGSQFLAQHLAPTSRAGRTASESEDLSGRAEQAAKAFAARLAPNPETTGAAARTIFGLASAATRMTAGSLVAGPAGGALLYGGTEAQGQYDRLTSAGVAPKAALESAGVRGTIGGLASLIPGGLGKGLLTRIISGAVANAGLGLGTRYADHEILAHAGYQHMADQQRVWDGAQLLADTLLGSVFGAFAHLHARLGESPASPRDIPGAEDAALATTLATRARSSGPGVAADPMTAQAHDAALQTATEQMLRGEPVNVDHTGVADGTFVERPEVDDSTAAQLLENALEEGGYLEEHQKLSDLEDELAARMSPGRQHAVAARAPESAPSLEEPPIAADHTRLFRGEKGPDYANQPSGPVVWFSDQRPVAENFAKMSGGKGPITYLDVPTGELERYRNGPGAFGIDSELAQGRQRLTSEPGRPQGDVADTRTPEVKALLAKAGRQQATPEEQQRLIDLGYAERNGSNPLTLFPAGRDRAGAAYATMKPWQQAVVDNPDMRIPGRWGSSALFGSGPSIEDVQPSEAASQTVNAAQALKQASDNVTEAEQKAPGAMDALANCVARRGF